jgi:hypothetical protein
MKIFRARREVAGKSECEFRQLILIKLAADRAACSADCFG